MTFFYDLNKKLDSIRAKPETTHKQLNERDMSRAAKGYEKYGKEGMEALAKAGREGKALDTVRAKYDKYDNKKDVEEGLGSIVKKIGGGMKRAAGKAMDVIAPGDEALLKDLQKKTGMPQTGKKPQTIAFHKSNTVDDNAVVGKVKEEYGPLEEKPMTPKQKSFAKLAPPADKITFADKIAGAKKEVDEMLGDVAAEAMKGALRGGQKKLDKNQNGKLDANDFAMLRKGGKQSTAEASGAIDFDKVLDAIAALYGDDIWENDAMQDLANDLEQAGPTDRELDFIIAKGKLPKRLAGIQFSSGDSVKFGEGWDDMLKDVDRRRSEVKPGHKVAGAKGDIEKTATGIKHTRRYDDKTGETDTGDETGADGQPAKRGRGRPKGTTGKIGAKGPSGKSKLMTKEADHDSDEVKQAMAVLKKAGYTVSKSGEEELEEKAVSKKQQKFMGMVHATQKGEKAPSKEVAKVAKSMGKKDAEDFAATKHKGLPEKKKPEGKKKEKTEEAGGTGTPTASSGFSFGKGIYDSMNRDLEQMIAESMNISMSMNNDMHGGPSKSLTVTATDEDAMMLGKLLKMAGVGSGGDDSMTKVDENSPDWPTNTESSDDALQYSGGLNKPKSTGQTTVPVIAGQENRMMTYEEQDDLARMMEMAGIREAAKPDYIDLDKDGNRKESMKTAADDKAKDKKVDESIFALTNQWKAYKG